MVPLANLLVAATGTWTSVLLVTAIASVGAGLLAKLAVDPLRRRMLRAEAVPEPGTSAIAAEVV